MSKRKSFIIHHDSLDIINKLSDEQAGRLLKAIKAYQLGEDYEADFTTDLIFTPFKAQFERDNEKYLKIVERNKNNGLKGGRPKTKENPEEPKKPSGFTPPTLQQVKDYCNERVNNIDPNKFINHYQAKGWLVGKVKMKDWKAAVRTWEGNEKQITTTTGSFDKSKWDQYV